MDDDDYDENDEDKNEITLNEIKLHQFEWMKQFLQTERPQITQPPDIEEALSLFELSVYLEIHDAEDYLAQTLIDRFPSSNGSASSWLHTNVASLSLHLGLLKTSHALGSAALGARAGGSVAAAVGTVGNTFAKVNFVEVFKNEESLEIPPF